MSQEINLTPKMDAAITDILRRTGKSYCEYAAALIDDHRSGFATIYQRTDLSDGTLPHEALAQIREICLACRGVRRFSPPSGSPRNGDGGDPEELPLPSVAHARKVLYDYLDSHRPWATPGVDVYEMMEAIVDYAAFAFRREQRPTKEQVTELERHLMRFTAALEEHPADYEGPCCCADCRSSS